MCSLFQGIEQGGWEYSGQGKGRRKSSQPRHPHLSSYSHPPSHHRRRGGKGKRVWKWYWHGAVPKKQRDPLSVSVNFTAHTAVAKTRIRNDYYNQTLDLLTTDSSSDVDLPQTNRTTLRRVSSMKTSFSMSSLQPPRGCLEGQDHANDRPFYSLRKKPRRVEMDEWRRSWGSRQENKDEFWAALANNYHYLMDNNLIDTCKEAGRDLAGGGSPTHEWSFDQFSEQFTELDAWLDSIQDALNNRTLRDGVEMVGRAYKRKLFNNQSGRLVARSPELKDEVAWRVSYLNSKWERLEQRIHLTSPAHSHLDIPTDIEHELRCLRKWIKETEKRLQPLDFKTSWTLEELELKAKEHEVVQKDVWQHGKVVCWLVKQCESLVGCESTQQSLSSWVRGRRLEPTQAASYARGLERRWQLLYLQALEWQCHIDTLTNTAKQQVTSLSVSVPESDEEPLTKFPRLALLSDSPQDEEDDILMMETTEIVEFKSEMEIEGGVAEDVESTEIISASSRLEQHVDCMDGLASVEERKRSQDGVTSPHDDRKRHQTESNVRLLIGQALSPGSARKLLLNENSKFNSSVRNGPNCASFYFKHLDTDTEQDCSASQSQPKSSCEGESSSEDEWTYSVTQEESLREADTQDNGKDGISLDNSRTNVMQPNSTLNDGIHQEEALTKEMITKLLEEAQEIVLEEIVTSPVRNRSSRVYEPLRFTDPATNTKYTLVKEWLLHHDSDNKMVGDSCDASGECTTEEEESGLDSTLVPVDEASERVVLRSHKPSGTRPWSVSGPVGLVGLHPPSPLPHSISESAIHELSASTPTSVHKMDGSNNNMSTLSSSTVEDVANQTQDGGSGGTYSSNSLRRRKHKLRKRSLMRKSESGGSESILAHSDGTLASPLKLPALAKLSMRRASAEKPVSDTLRRHLLVVASPSSSETDSDSESENSVRHQQKASIQPAFRLGPAHTVCAYASERKDKIVSADSSFSETAWDNYQEKYMSEAYSEEAPDSETARKILDFGDDYRNFLDSQSDCASSLGPTPLLHKRRRPAQQTAGESDSEFEDVWQIVRQSTTQLFYSEKVFNTQLCRASPHLVLASDFAELVSTCKDNISVLTQLLEKIEEGTALLSAEQCKDIRDLISQWERLERSTEELQKERSLKREMAALRDELLEIATRSTALEADLEDRSQLELRIQEVKGELSRLRDLNKTQLFQVNLAVHRYLTDSSAPPSHLKDQVADLYRLWNDTHIRSCSRLRSLEEAGAAWQQFESHLATLQVALRGDQEALRLLHVALQEGQAVSPNIATSLRDIAKLLSEKQESDPNTLTMQEGGREIEVLGATEGSLSDSGISDSGSEQELSERERRLSALRRLVRHLEPVLAPNSQAIAKMSKRLEATERELRSLQQTCRELIVKTAVCVEAKGKLSPLTNNASVLNSKSSHPQNSKSVDVGGGKKVSERWVARILKAALPFHIALVALFCIACLLEPHCCDSFNNLDFSLSPQLRFVKGPPPV